ncbi:MAG: GNAT family N-acetyltransferase [Bacteroidia bacterium]|nr:GNAT family N-acetyltransferase [Bacteroidia bacterium]
MKTATEQEICLHLKECNDNFFPPLVERVSIEEYAKKIENRSITFEAWSESILVGLVAVYMNATTHSAFITNVSILKKYMGLRISTKLTRNCIEYVKQNNFKEIKLEVHKKNVPAIGLYNKNNFIKYDFNGDLDLMKLEIK